MRECLGLPSRLPPIGHTIRKGETEELRILLSILGGPEAIPHICATEELFVPWTILVDQDGIVVDLTPGWSKETQRKYAALAGTP